MIKVVYIVKHRKEDVYLRSFRMKLMTTKIQQAFRAATWEEAQAAIERVATVPLAWDVVPIEYDTLPGKVVSKE